MKKISLTARVLLGIASLSMLATLAMPLWQIQLWAPQYPEGLNMKIWHNRLSGAFDIINGLNHYIGMREIKAEMFPEFQYIGILIGVFTALGLVAALIGTRRWLLAFVSASYLLGAAALYDFYRWGYDYGHNLDPHAAIVVPGMFYQPPVLGYKNLLNFTAYSGPDQGGWLIIAVGVLATLIAVYEFFVRFRKVGKMGAALLGTGLLTLSSCTTGPEPIQFGQDACHNCKMTITDARFGAEVVSRKGKVYKFDDLNCMHQFLKGNTIPADQIAHVVAIDFAKPASFVPVQQAFFLQHEAIKSPMRSDVATFSNADERQKVKNQLGGGQEMNWESVRNSF